MKKRMIYLIKNAFSTCKKSGKQIELEGKSLFYFLEQSKMKENLEL